MEKATAGHKALLSVACSTLLFCTALWLVSSTIALQGARIDSTRSLPNVALLAPADTRVRYYGRVDRTAPHEARFAWVMSGVGCSVSGASSLIANLSAPSTWNATLRVMVDGVLEKAIELGSRSPMHAYLITSNLGAGVHIVEILKVSEGPADANSTDAQNGIVAFGGFAALDGTFGLAPAARARKLEFIGDSDTVAYCVNGSAASWGAEDAYESWAMVIARNLSADVMVEAYSGYGVTRHSRPIQPWLDSTLGFETMNGVDGSGVPGTAKPKRDWDYSSWTPDAVVMLIGPNDLWESFREISLINAYVGLIDQVSRNYIDAVVPPKIINVCGGSGNGFGAVCTFIRAASTQFNEHSRAGKIKSYYTSISQEHWNELNADGRSEYNGCESHYNARGHAKLARDIIPQLQQILGW